MLKLSIFELTKLWKKKNFIIAVITMLIINVFLIWYNSTSTERDTDIEAERNIVSNYGEYLKQIQDNKKLLEGVSIFATSKTDSYSSRNIEKSAKDYEKLTDANIRFIPSEGLKTVSENVVTDILIILSVVLVAGSLITEEKEKKFFYITRATKNGIAPSIVSKLTALLIHCVVITVVFYLCNILYAATTCGIGNVFSRIQSAAVYSQSNLNISVLLYFVFTMLTKAIVFYIIGCIMIFINICVNKTFLSIMAGITVISVSAVFYYAIPAYSSLNYLKYLNLYGLLKTENIYGGYLNLNLFGYPVSRLILSWAMILIHICICQTLVIVAFCKGKRLENSNIKIRINYEYKAHNCLFLHESSKILFMNKGIVILVVFLVLIGFRIINTKYYPSSEEKYYHDMCMQLEGNLTLDKEKQILTEKERYEEAFSQIEHIDELVSNNEISPEIGDSLKDKYYNIVFFYPAFEKIYSQYEQVSEHDGKFMYDTGYLYFNGRYGEGIMLEYILLTICFVLTYGGVMAMEYQKKSWTLLSATIAGRSAIIRRKLLCCILCTALCIVILSILRLININGTFELRNVGGIVLIIAKRIAIMEVVSLVVILISEWRKNYIQTVFLGMVLLTVPALLQYMGLNFMKWCSLQTLYNGVII